MNYCQSKTKQGPKPLFLSAVFSTGSQNVLAVLLVEVCKVLQTVRNQGQVERGQRSTSTHNNQLNVEVVHHELEEVVSHLVPIVLLGSAIGVVRLQFITQAHSQ